MNQVGDAVRHHDVQHNGDVIAGVFHRFESVGPGSFLIAFAAGVLSFLSPCVLPLVPGYISIVTGLDLPTLSESRRSNRRRVTITTSLFVAGFAIVYVPIGTAAGAFGSALRTHQAALTRTSGVLLLAFAVFLGASVVVKAPWIYQEFRFHPRFARAGRGAPIVLGAAFAFGWTPCVGPIAGSATTIAAESGRAWTGAALLAVYTLGLGLPFLICGLALSTTTNLLRRVRRHFGAIIVASAIIMAIFAMLLITNQFAILNQHLSNFLQDHGMSWIKDYS